MTKKWVVLTVLSLFVMSLSCVAAQNTGKKTHGAKSVERAKSKPEEVTLTGTIEKKGPTGASTYTLKTDDGSEVKLLHRGQVTKDGITETINWEQFADAKVKVTGKGEEKEKKDGVKVIVLHSITSVEKVGTAAAAAPVTPAKK